jgi:hypothetical protein
VVVGYATTGTATAVGYAAGGFKSAQTQTGVAKATGYAALGIPAAPSPGSSPDALRVEILDSSGTQILNDMVQRRDLSFTVEHNGSGSVSFQIDLDSLALGIDDPAIAEANLVRVHYGDLAAWPNGVAEGFITSAPPTQDDSGRWSVTVSCPGTWDALDFGVLWPPAGATGDTREFSYTAGQTGPAWVPEEWGKPVGKKVRTSFRWTEKKHHYPRGWPEDQSEWLWTVSPETDTTNVTTFLGFEETRKFVATAFTLAAKKAVHFYAAGDDTMKLYLNGARIKTKGRGGWRRTASFVRTLNAGTYVVAAEVSNTPGGDGRAGFICAVAQLKAGGAREKWLLRSSPDTFQVKTAAGYFAQVPLPPDGWYPAAVLLQHVSEANGRGVTFHNLISATYTSAVDSYGSAWTDKGQSEYQIDTTGAALGDMVRASGVDVAMLPGLKLCAWRHRGFDLRDRVIISAPMSTGWGSRTWSRVRTVGLTHHESGWTETAGDPTVAATYGRREMAISGGGTDGDLQADALAAQALRTAGEPEETIEVTITSADLRSGAPQPFRDFNVADIISAETKGGFTPIKVMSITGAEQESKEVRWTIAGYPV